jgi:hypothetical protein
MRRGGSANPGRNESTVAGSIRNSTRSSVSQIMMRMAPYQQGRNRVDVNQTGLHRSAWASERQSSVHPYFRPPAAVALRFCGAAQPGEEFPTCVVVARVVATVSDQSKNSDAPSPSLRDRDESWRRGPIGANLIGKCAEAEPFPAPLVQSSAKFPG